MKFYKKSIRSLLGIGIIFLIGIFFTACDMNMIERLTPPNSGEEEQARNNNEPCLTILNLPSNSANYHFSNIVIFNSVTNVAECYSNESIVLANIIKEGERIFAAHIPLVSSFNSDTFTDTGYFYISFILSVDARTHYSFSRNDNIVLFLPMVTLQSI